MGEVLEIKLKIEDLDFPIDVVALAAKIIKSEMEQHPETYDAFVMSIRSVLTEMHGVQSETILAMKIANRILDIGADTELRNFSHFPKSVPD